MRLRSGGRCARYVRFALEELEKQGTIEIHGQGANVQKVVAVVESVKREFGGKVEASSELCRDETSGKPKLTIVLKAIRSSC